MKKNALVFLLSAILLSGCDLSFDFINKQQAEQTSQNSQETTKDEQNPVAETGETNNGASENTTQEPQPEPIGQNDYTGTISTSGTNFEKMFSSGSHFDTTEKVETLTNHIKGQLRYSDLVKNITCTNLHTQEYNDVTYLQFGSGKGIGALAFESDIKIYKVEVKVLCFAKYDSTHQITNIDSWSHFLINDQDNDMTYDGKTNPSVMTFEKTFEEGVNSFTLASKDGRVYLKEMSITWRG